MPTTVFKARRGQSQQGWRSSSFGMGRHLMLLAFSVVLLAPVPLSCSSPLSARGSEGRWSLGAKNDAGIRRSQKEGHATSSASREDLYEAYSLLHALAKDFSHRIEAPQVIIVGEQTSGKSALVEALMGFQFNEVGGGTKTRRPITLDMRYNPACSTPTCYLTDDSGNEEQMSLPAIRSYIESQNQRLEADPTRCFDHRDINIRVEYRYCPNMIMTDTPGLISTNPLNDRVSSARQRLNPQQRALARASKEAEMLVLNKIKHPEYIILCIEDVSDWKHMGAVRSLVEQADPGLSRTVLVNTKLDTKLLQFSQSEDMHHFLEADIIHKLHPNLLGGPFYTSVPCGRVSKDFRNDEDFVRSLRGRERADAAILTGKLGAMVAQPIVKMTGVRLLRSFLERRVEECYRRNVASIVPMLQSELRLREEQLSNTERELRKLSTVELKKAADQFREHFSRALASTIQGSISAPPTEFGETAQEEQLRGGTFHSVIDSDGDGARGVSVAAWNQIVGLEVGNAHARLFGGAQYHRALREFALAVYHMTLPEVTEDEIANAGGMSDIHDGANFMRAACVIAVEKAQISFEPLLEALRLRLIHVMKRLFVVVDYMLEQQNKQLRGLQYQAFTKAIHRTFDSFVDQQMEYCLDRCRDDLTSMTRFVTWDLKERGNVAVRSTLPNAEMVQIYSLAVKRNEAGEVASAETANQKNKKKNRRKQQNPAQRDRDARTQREEGIELAPDHRELEILQDRDSMNLLHLMEQASCMRDTNRTNSVVTALVRQIVSAWRASFAQNVAMKFNCFFLLPFLDEFPFFLRTTLDELNNGEMTAFMDLREVREELSHRVQSLRAECEVNTKLQHKFEAINEQLSHTPGDRNWDEDDLAAQESSPLDDMDDQHFPPPPPPMEEDYDDAFGDYDDLMAAQVAASLEKDTPPAMVRGGASIRPNRRKNTGSLGGV